MTTYLIQELILGKSIQSYIKEKYAFSESECRLILRSIMSGLSYVHYLKICHRDLHYGNVLYDSQSKSVKIIDFSVAKVCQNDKVKMMTQTGILYFMAPEMLKGTFYDFKIDIWSAGIIFYTVLFGRLPFGQKK